MTRKMPCGLVIPLVVVCFLAGIARAQSGEVLEWGRDSSELRSIGGVAKAVAAGNDYSCAIQAATDTVLCWRRYYEWDRLEDAAGGPAAALGAGSHHTCATRPVTGAVVCWGMNFQGQTTVPSAVNGTTGSASVIGDQGQDHSCVIQAGTGAVVCWGADLFPDDVYGQAIPPPSVDGTLGTASAISLGSSHSCAIQAGSGAVICWGHDGYGEASPPPEVDGSAGTAAAIAAGGWHTCAIRAQTGAVVCWGWNEHGQATPPPPVDGTLGTASAVAAGRFHTCAIQAGTGAVVCWGLNRVGQSTPPAALDGVHGKALAIAVGDHTIAIRVPECSDGLENDRDGLVDFPDDPGCEDASDLRERFDAQCDDGVDNDGDGRADFPADPGCAGAADPAERGAQCDDGVDNDGDGLVDSPLDPGCNGLADPSERGELVCDDGLDNDLDGLIDYPSDSNCLTVRDPSEFTVECDDGLDNDGNGLIDQLDPGCVDVNDTGEASLRLMVTKTADTDDGVCDADCSLREAIAVATQDPGDDFVQIPAGVYPLDAMLDASQVTLQGAGALHTAIEPSGLFASGSVRLRDLTIRGAGSCALSFLTYGSLQLDSVTLQENGIGLCLGRGASALIRNSSIVRNQTGVFSDCIVDIFSGGGCNQTVTLENSTVSDNAEHGLWAWDAAILLVSSTVAGNGALGVGTYFGATRLRHSIVAGNADQCVGRAISLGHNIASDWTCNLDQPTDRPATDPMLASAELGPNGTWTRRPAAGSPAIDGGDPLGCTEVSGAAFARDQRGVPRPLDGDGDGVAVCDVGAHEVAACFDGTDEDGDGLCRAADNCPSVSNVAQADLDADVVGDACDNCTAVANPRVSEAWLDANPWALLSGGQRDDDRDGFGNRCDAKFPGTGGSFVGPADLRQMRASKRRSRLDADCGLAGTLHCAIFDLDDNVTGSNEIGASDVSRFLELNGARPGPKCAACPVSCEAGALRSCSP